MQSPSKQEVRGTRRKRTSSNTTKTGNHNSRHDDVCGLYDETKEDKDDYVASMILSMLDMESYEEAAWEDADRIMKNHILPKCLLWAKPQVPLLRSLPRDIEDMLGVLHAGDDEEGDPYRKDSNSGRLGYGMFDMGGLCKVGVKGTLAESVITKPIGEIVTAIKSPSKEKGNSTNTNDQNYHVENEDDVYPSSYNPAFVAASRRSEFPGVIELTVKLPLPSLESSIVRCQDQNLLYHDDWLNYDERSIKIAKAFLHAERAEICSSMPLYWKRIDEGCYKEPPSFVGFENEGISLDECSNHSSVYTRMKMREKRKRKIEALSNGCTRKWLVSVKVASVSSRPNLLRRDIKAMRLKAELPSYVQYGKSLTIESAYIKDQEEGLRSSLGSYDCRATSTTSSMSYEAMDNIGLKNSNGRSKRINVGRTRLIWAAVSAANTKPSYASMLTGEKLDSSSYKRPKSVVIMVRLNGSIISEPVDEDGDQKRRKDDKYVEKYTWSKSKVHKAFEAIKYKAPVSIISDTSEDEEQFQTALCTIDMGQYFKTLLEHNSEVANQVNCPDYHVSTINLSPSTSVLRKIRKPRIHCLPIDDGFLRVLCVNPGVLEGSLQYPTILSDIAKLNKDGPLCTVCWTGSEQSDVLCCESCNLYVHKECCLDTGRYKETTKSISWTCARCTKTPYEEYLPKLNTVQTHPQYAKSDRNSHYVPTGSRKSQRRTKLPSKFKEDALEDENMPTIVRQLIDSKTTRYRSNPKCTLCPFAGGAMSITKKNEEYQRWTHEVCRIWCSSSINVDTGFSADRKFGGMDMDTSINSVLQDPVQDIVCCLCGMGKIHNEGQVNEEVLQVTESPNAQISPSTLGLIKCAATGCSLYFHPMCALLYTKFSQEYFNHLRKDNPKGSFQSKDCDHYELDFVQVSRKEGTSIVAGMTEMNEDDDDEQTYILPVGFCGLHNKLRGADIYGMPPRDSEEFEKISRLMKIPYQLD